MKARTESLKIVTFALIAIASFSALMFRAGFKRNPDMDAPPKELEPYLLALQWDKVEELAIEWISDGSVRKEAWVIRGYAAYSQGNASEGTKHQLWARCSSAPQDDFRWAAGLGARFPGNAVAQFLSGDALFREGRREAALARLDKALLLDKAFVLAHLARGSILISTGKAEEAMRDLDGIATNSPVVAEALVLQGLAHLAAGSSSDAATDIDQALELEPTHSIAYNTRGVIRARAGDWSGAAEDFEIAFHLTPELTEARLNWQLARSVLEERGALIASKWDRKDITIVTAADPKDMRGVTSLAADMVRQQTGRNPFIARDLDSAENLAKSHPVILQMPGAGLKAGAGETMLRTLNDLRGKASVNVVSYGLEASQNAATGILRHQNTRSAEQRVQINSLQLVDPSEMAGLAGKIGLGVSDNAGLARDVGKIRANGVQVAAYLTQDKLGMNHLGNVKAYRDVGNIDTYVTPWKGGIQTGLGLGGKGISGSVGIANATDKGSSRNDLGPRDWTIVKGGLEQRQVGTLADLGKQYIKADVLAPSTPAARPSPGSPGGIRLSSMNLTASSAGRVAFGGATPSGGDLRLVCPVFGTSLSAKSGVPRLKSCKNSLSKTAEAGIIIN